ncbi:FAD-binding oxidoreductase [Nonomuraea sp. KC401]|uniref:FAD-binding oxidoreductase n=1 Tax=unclassified Nonomuraea TaxID=2593643 RepID=UPI0010FCFD9D|nr:MULTISPECIES: FAD-binding oxidoreductase [unclassified Nonomuraea]NBE97000.1 FAD-binding protein [Nonomuraea sp. K271]TLF66252.1 FAD-binding oxidoreductase [Nonomuraea sp. KC401]
MTLAAGGVTVRRAGERDAVSGVVPRWVALPETVEEIAAVLRACEEQDLAVVPVGGGTKLHWGHPPERCDVLLDMCCMNEILEHAAGDLVVRAQAGVTMDALAAALAGKGQELALDPPFAEQTTVGGTLAAATAGPRAFRYGTARDLLIGVTVVLPDGTVARSGGKVVKNVAGYDLGKLFTGSRGTLGVIAEATFRLHPLPALRRWVVAATEVAGLAGETLPRLAASQAEPSAVDIDCPDGRHATIAVLVEGSAAEHRAQALRDVLGDGTITDVRPDWWGRILTDEVLAELRFPPARTTEALAAAGEAGFSFRGSAATGHAYLERGGEVSEAELTDAVDRLRTRIEALGGRVSVPASPYDGVDRWGQVSTLPLMRRVKERFDPGRRMSPGRFAGRI